MSKKMFTAKGRPKKILFVASEAAPFARVGGLGSVMYSLPRALRVAGHDVRLFIPRYIGIDPEAHGLTTECENLKVPVGNKGDQEHVVCNIKKFESEDEDGPVTTYFLENQEYYEQRANIYGYSDDHVRWALLSRGALEFIRQESDWTPDVIVASDWMTGILPNYLKTIYKDDKVLSKIASVFSIHNLFFQGLFDHRFVQELDYDDGHSPVPQFHEKRLSKINSMRRGIMHADMVNTVSPSYAREIMTEEYGEGLESLLIERRSVLTGILNGIDHCKWDPLNNPAIQYPFSSKKIKDRMPNKAALQAHFGLPERDDVFLVGMVSRIDHQKGFDLLTSVIETLLQELSMQFILVGEGDTGMMSFFRALESKFPDKVATHLKFDDILPHKVFAGSDAVLIPSRFEPSGLVQMEAMRYGAIPIVRKTGGLADTVKDYDPVKNTGTGFVFERLDPLSLLTATIRAYETFRHKGSWQKLQVRAMTEDFSWQRSAKEYDKLFTQAIKLRDSMQVSDMSHEMG